MNTEKKISTLDDLLGLSQNGVDASSPNEEETFTDHPTSTSQASLPEQSTSFTAGFSVDESLKLLSFGDLFKITDFPIRVTNSILAAIDAGVFPFDSVGDYYYGTESHKDKIGKIQNFGRNSRTKLDEGIESIIKSRERLGLAVTEIHKNNYLLSSETLHKILHEPLSVMKEIKFQDFIENFGVLNRTKHAISPLFGDGSMWIDTLFDYYCSSAEDRERLLTIPNFGRLSLEDLNKSIERLKNSSKVLSEFVSKLIILGKYEVDESAAREEIEDTDFDRLAKAVKLIDFVAYYNVSERVKNVIGSDSSQHLFRSVYEYIHASSMEKAKLLQLPNFGKKSLHDLDDAINDVVSNPDRLSALFYELGKDGKADPELADVTSRTHAGNELFEGLSNRIDELLTDREQEVLVLRLSDKKCTLEKCGQKFGVTRERIRQIESKALRKIKKECASEIVAVETIIHNLLAENGGVVDVQNARDTLGQLDEFAFVVLLTISVDQNIGLIMKDGLLWSRDLYGKRKSLYIIIDEQFKQGMWPVQISSISIHADNVPQSLVRDRLLNRFSAVIEDDTVVMAQISSSDKTHFALRSLGQPSHTTIVHKKLLQMFPGSDVSHHTVEAALGKSPYALVVDRGTYALYENLPVRKEDIAEIRDIAYQYLQSKGDYIKSERIYEDLFKGMSYEGFRINPYVVLGVLQDDPARFITKPGLLIGLPKFGDTYQISDYISQVVREHGPISIKQIHDLIPKERKVGKSSISTSLLSNKEMILVDKNTYDTVDKVIGGEDELYTLITDIRYRLRSEKMKSKQIYQEFIEEKYSTLTEHGLRVLLRKHFDHENGLFYSS